MWGLQLVINRYRIEIWNDKLKASQLVTVQAFTAADAITQSSVNLQDFERVLSVQPIETNPWEGLHDAHRIRRPQLSDNIRR